MIKESIKKGIITMEISVLIPEKFLNLLWSKKVKVVNVTRLDITTLKLDVEYKDYKKVQEIVKKCNGKFKVVGREGLFFFLLRLRRQGTLIIGGCVFLLALYFLSTYVWAIEIKTGDNLSPYEVRQQLNSLGITPGMRKSAVDVYELEKKLESVNSDILWLRARVEGSTLKILIEEKVNPPKGRNNELNEGCIAKVGGEVIRIFVNSGTAAVKVGDIVREGDILINPLQGNETNIYEVPARGTVIANTFYTKEMEVQIKGKKEEFSGEKDTDIYINLAGKKIYLKKSINKFENYDKIEGNGGVFNKVTYFEKINKDINLDKDESVNIAVKKLENSLTKVLSNDAKIKDKKIEVENLSDEIIRVRVNFVVEQDIALVNE